VKAFQEQNVKGPLTSLVFAILIVEDLIAILLLAVLTPIATGVGVSAGWSLASVRASRCGFASRRGWERRSTQPEQPEHGLPHPS
jgi:Kef-type K+ transport system membrane component KefB